MPDETVNNEESPEKKNESNELDLVTEQEKDNKTEEEFQSSGNDPAAVNEAAQQAEKAVCDAINGMAQIINAMKS
jgi:hypothetical protein